MMLKFLIRGGQVRGTEKKLELDEFAIVPRIEVKTQLMRQALQRNAMSGEVTVSHEPQMKPLKPVLEL